MEIISRRIISNSLWMILEKFINIFGVIFVTSFVAKYIGPTNFGKIALATTVFTFVQMLSWFGNQEILFKRVSKNKKSGLQYLSATQKLRRKIFIGASIPVLVWFYLQTDTVTFIFGIATALASFFLVQDIFVVYNNATLNSHLNALANIIGLVFAFFLRYIIAYFELDILYLSIPIVAVTFIPYLLKKFYFNRRELSKEIKQSRYTRYYLSTGGALVVSNLSITLYTQITSLLLVAITSTKELGIYSVAATLGMSWAFINQAVITSILTNIYREQNRQKTYLKFFQLNWIVILISLFIIALVYFLGDKIIFLLYGEEYLPAIELFLIISFATLFSGVGTVSARFLIKEEGYRYISRKMFIVAVCSILIAYSCISIWKLSGAAYSVLLIELLSATLFNYFYKGGEILKIHFYPFFYKKTESV